MTQPEPDNSASPRPGSGVPVPGVSDSDTLGGGSGSAVIGDPSRVRPDTPTIATFGRPSSSVAALAAAGFVESLVGRSIGHYRIEGLIGEGGMGAVYLARQEMPDRQVALKVIRPGYTSETTLRRFQFEAEVLGRLQHPGIAQIYEAGVYTSPERERAGLPAVPYFAMEYVRGVDLMTYADRSRLSVRQRLELCAKVCDAVEHAHTKGVIHRDLKPGNILVDEAGQPKVLDFGTARAIDHDANAVTMRTDVGQLVGTIPYMSPEQVSGDPMDVDTRCDVYALGVVAFELLTGSLPHNLGGKMIHEAVAIIRDTPPTRLSAIDRGLRGDVETIVTTALDREKARRYASAGTLAADIRRYLRNEPIIARPASAAYQLRKFVRRNRLLVGSVVTVFVVLLAAFAVVSRSLVRTIEAEHRATRSFHQALEAQAAESRLRVKAEKARQLAEDEAETSRQVNKFLNDMLASVNPGQGNRLITVREVLDESARRIGASFVNRPIIEAQTRATIAGSYLGLGEAQEALSQAKAAAEILERNAGPEDPRTIGARAQMATALQNLGDLDGAEKLFREVLERSERVLGPESRDTLAHKNNLAQVLAMAGKVAEAERLLEEAVAQLQSHVGEEASETLDALGNYAVVLQWQSKYELSEQVTRRVLSLRRRVLGDEHPTTIIAVNNLATLMADLGRPEEALAGYMESLELSRRVLGDDHPDTLTSISNVAGGLTDLRRLTEGEKYYREALALRERKLGPAHPDTVQNLIDLGINLDKQQRRDDAIIVLQDAVNRAKQPGTPGSQGTSASQDRPESVLAQFQLGRVLTDAGRAAEAEPLLVDCLQRQEALSGNDYWRVAMMRVGLGICLEKLDKLDEAEAQLLKGYQQAVEQLGADSSWARRGAKALATVYFRRSDAAKSEQWRVLSEEPAAASAPSTEPEK